MRTNRESIKSTNRHTFKVGDKVLVNTQSNLGLVPCTVRALFMQQTTTDKMPRPAVVLEELSWAYECDCTCARDHKPKAIQMHRTHTIAGVPVSFKRSIIGWFAVFGPDRSVSFREVTPGVWQARLRMALEPLIWSAPTLASAVQQTRDYFTRQDAATAARIAARLEAR